jgi:hypothetical protein
MMTLTYFSAAAIEYVSPPFNREGADGMVGRRKAARK